MREGDNHTTTEFDDHMRVINDLVDQWHVGEISTKAKRARIAAENQRYYGKPIRSRASDELITRPPRAGDDVAEVLAASYQVPLSVMTAALRARRAAYRAANYTNTNEEYRRLYAKGIAEYNEILTRGGARIPPPDREPTLDITEPRRSPHNNGDGI